MAKFIEFLITILYSVGKIVFPILVGYLLWQYIHPNTFLKIVLFLVVWGFLGSLSVIIITAVASGLSVLLSKFTNK